MPDCAIRTSAAWLLSALLLGCDAGPRRHTLRPCIGPPVGEAQETVGEPAGVESLHRLGCGHVQNKRFSQAIDIYRRLVELAPQDADGHYYLGVALAKERSREAAVDAFEKALAIEPGFVEALCAAALLHNEREDGHQEALRMVDRAIVLAPEQAFCHFIRGFILQARGHDAQAMDALEAAIALDDSLAHARYYLGLLHQRREDHSEAMAAFEAVVDLDPLYARAYYNLASLYARSGRMEDGARVADLFREMSSTRVQESHYRQILYREASPRGARKGAYHYNLGQLYLKGRRSDLAQQEFQAALEADPENAEAAHNLGVVWSQRGEMALAIPRFLRALEIRPGYGLAWENLGNSYLATGDYPAAERAYRQAIAFHDNSAAATYGLGTALIQQGKIAEGRTYRAAARVAREPRRGL